MLTDRFINGPNHGPRKVAAMPDDQALRILRNVLDRLRSQPWERDRWSPARIQAAREEALNQYGMIRSPELVRSLDEKTFLGFLLSENNRHRIGFGRVGQMTADMPRSRQALAILVDEQVPLRTRLDQMRPPGGKPMVQGLGPGVITLILHFVDPNRYGILNGTSERLIRRLGLYPDVPVTESLATRYAAVNSVLLKVAAELKIDLGLLDTLWWRVLPQDFASPSAPKARAR